MADTESLGALDFILPDDSTSAMLYDQRLYADGRMTGIASLSPAVIQSVCGSILKKQQTPNESKNDSWAAVSFDTSQVNRLKIAL